MVMTFGSKIDKNGDIKNPKPCPGYKTKTPEKRQSDIDELMLELQSSREYTMSMRRGRDVDEYGEVWNDWCY